MTPQFLEILHKLLIRHEGLSLKLYQDTKKLYSIGIGRNLDGVGLRNKDEAIYLLNNDITHFINFIKINYPFFDNLDICRQIALIDFCFAGEGILEKFPKMMESLRLHQFSITSDELLNSDYAKKDVPHRAKELANIFLTGKLPSDL